MLGKGPLFVYTLTIMGIGCALFQPFVSVIIYIIFAVLSPNALWYYSLPETFFNSSVGYSAAVAYPMIFGWLLKHCGNFKIGKAFFPMFLLTGYLMWATLSSFLTGWNALGQETLVMLLRLLIAMTIVLTLCDSTKRLKCVIWALIFASGFVAYELNMSYLQGFNRLQIAGYAGMDNNFFAVSMVVGATVAFYTGLAERNAVLKAFAFLSAVLQAHVIMFSMSRGGMLGLCVVALFTFFVLPKTLTNMTFFVIAIMVGLSLAGDSVRERFFSAFEDTENLDGSAQSRIKSWKNCLEVIREKPVMGIGIQNWATYSFARFGMHLEAHSTWLQCAAETGVPGLFMQFGFVFITAWRMLPLARGKLDVPDPNLKYYGQMVIASMAGYTVAAQFVSLYYMEIVFYTCLIGLCCLKLSHLKKLAAQDEELTRKAEQQEAIRMAERLRRLKAAGMR